MLQTLLLSGAICLAQGNWALVWRDEFDNPSIDRSSWTYDTGGGGWGNQELQYYTDRPENSRITALGGAPGTGYLLIEALEESFQKMGYTSARMKTLGLKSWKYGRVEISALVPGGRGVWPALWMMGTDLPQKGWPECGEIDIMEHVENGADMTPESIRGTIHGPGYSGVNSMGAELRIPTLQTNFHTYGMEWDPTGITWDVDGDIFYTVSPSQVPGGPAKWRFDHDFFILVNLAIGGNWGGPPTDDTKFPVRYWIDWVRVYQDVAAANLTVLENRWNPTQPKFPRAHQK